MSSGWKEFSLPKRARKFEGSGNNDDHLAKWICAETTRHTGLDFGDDLTIGQYAVTIINDGSGK